MFYLGTSRTRPVFCPEESHLLVIGPPRSGKTTSFVVPNIAIHSGPVVVTSTKADVLLATKAHRAEGGRLWLFDPSGALESPPGIERLRWSFVDGASNLDNAILIAESAVDTSIGLVHGSARHWSDRAKAMLAPLLLAAHVSELEIEDVVRWVDGRDVSEASSILVGLGAYRPEEILSGVLASEPRELSAIYSTVSSALAVYRSEAAVALGSQTNFDPDSFVRSQDTLYIVSPSTVQRHSAPVIVGLIDAVRGAAYRNAAEQGFGRSVTPVAMLLDEMANIAPLGNLGSILAEGASQGIALMGCVQDLSQARGRWPEIAGGFLTLFGTTALLPGIGDVETLTSISKLIGDELVLRTSRSVSSTGRGIHRLRATSRSTSLAEVDRPKLSVSALATLERGTAAILRPAVGVGLVDLGPSLHLPPQVMERQRGGLAVQGVSRESHRGGSSR